MAVAPVVEKLTPLIEYLEKETRRVESARKHADAKAAEAHPHADHHSDQHGDQPHH